MKRILLLADINSPHTQKWAVSLYQAGFEIGVFSFTGDREGWSKNHSAIRLFCSERISPSAFNAPGVVKLQFLKVLPLLNRTIRDFKPSLLHAHYASSYGLIGSLSFFKPFFISVWGSDVYDFPVKSFLHAAIIRFNLSRADRIFSTSYVMAEQTARYTSKKIEVIHFGIPADIFKPAKVNSMFNENDIVIGTIKKLEEKYGVQYLIRAFKLVKERYHEKPLKLLLVGDGSQRSYLEKLVGDLDLQNEVVFTGNIPYSQVPVYHNMLTVAVYVSTLDSESFGVSVIESSACGKPVVVSNIGGLPEVVEDGVTGFLVPPRNPVATADAICKLLEDELLAGRLGINGRKRVIDLYDWPVCLNKMILAYHETIMGTEREGLKP